MNLAAVLTAEPWMERLGWVLIHFVWQGAAIALLLAGALRLLAGRSSRSRYAACGLALVLCCTAPAMTWVVLSPAATADVQAVAPLRPAAASAIEVPVRERPDFQPASGAASTDGIEEPWQNRLLEEIDAISPYLVALWLMGVLVLATRMAWAWMLTRQLCRLGTPIRNEVLLLRWRDLLERMAIRLPVRLLESAQVDVPTLIGWLRPTILLPATVLTGLTPDQLEAVLAHELAHVRRFDYLFNLLQSLVETILFYHPAVWWIGRRMREERENCCDDVSLDVVQNRHVYASALALLERGVNPSGDPRDGSTPLAMAIEQARPKNEELLRRAGAHDVSELTSAAAYGDVGKVDELLEKGANADDGDTAGRSPLSYAIRRGQVETAKALVAHGASLNKFDSQGLSPWGELQFMSDFFKENPDLVQLNWHVSLQEAQIRLTAFQQLFARDFAGPNYRDSQGRTALHLMALAGNPMVAFFAGNNKHRANPNIQDNDGNTPLLLAALSPRAEDLAPKVSTVEDARNPNQPKEWNAEAYVADNLIKAGARLDLVVRNGKTVGELALAAAVKANNAQLISVLQAAGAKLPVDSPPVPVSPGKSDSVRAAPPVPPSGMTTADAGAPGAVQIELGLAEISDDDYQVNRGKIDVAMKAGGPKLLGLLDNMKGVDLVCAPSVSGQLSKTAHIDIVRKFPYATTFATDKDGKIVPKDFATAEVGIQSAITATKENGKIQLNCTLSLTDFDGFAESNIGAKVPTFHTVDTRIVEEVPATGEIRGVWVPGARADTETITDKDESGKTTVTRRNVSKRLILFLGAKSAA
jgi:beta-lactamase regulating signal transducer with metallopeptidase domain